MFYTYAERLLYTCPAWAKISGDASNSRDASNSGNVNNFRDASKNIETRNRDNVRKKRDASDSRGTLASIPATARHA